MVKERRNAHSPISLLEELLPVIDNFEMGMAAASADASSIVTSA
ncbi:MAG: hypothetical protein ACLT8C_06590 [Akkermansia muciniphila]